MKRTEISREEVEHMKRVLKGSFVLLSTAEIAGFYLWPWRPLGAPPFPMRVGVA